MRIAHCEYKGEEMSQLTLRDLFWLTFVAALSIGWWLDHNRSALALANERCWKPRAEQMQQVLEKEGWTVNYGESDGSTIIAKLEEVGLLFKY